MNLGNAIQIIRKHKKISQLELAEKCNISQAALSKIESGFKKPGSNTLDKLCVELDTPKSLLYILAIQDDDVPKNKKNLYDALFPSIKQSILSIVQDD